MTTTAAFLKTTAEGLYSFLVSVPYQSCMADLRMAAYQQIRHAEKLIDLGELAMADTALDTAMRTLVQLAGISTCA